MLLVMPQLAVDDGVQTASAASYGADEVWQAFQEMRADQGSQDLKTRYEKAMLKFIYYHNWYTGHGECPGAADTQCANEFLLHGFWFGLASPIEANLPAEAAIARLSSSTVAAWEQQVSTSNQIYNFGTMPGEA